MLEALARQANELRPLLSEAEWAVIKRQYWHNPHVRLPNTGYEFREVQWVYPWDWRRPWRTLRDASWKRPYRSLVRHGAPRLTFDEAAARMVMGDLARRLQFEVDDAFRIDSEDTTNAEGMAVVRLKQAVGWPMVHALEGPEVCDRIARWALNRPGLSSHFYFKLASTLEALSEDNGGNWDTRDGANLVRTHAFELDSSTS